MILGITGGTGTGKSSVCKFFEKRGFVIIDSDRVARNVCEKGSACLDEIVQEFGTDMLDENGNLKRKELGRIVFSDGQKLNVLNEITHKYIVADINRIIEDNMGKDVVVDAPLLIETNLDRICDTTLCILADKELRKKRIMARDNLTSDEAQKRISSQPDDEFYTSRCDFVLYNNADTDSLYEKLFDMFGGNDGK